MNHISIHVLSVHQESVSYLIFTYMLIEVILDEILIFFNPKLAFKDYYSIQIIYFIKASSKLLINEFIENYFDRVD